MLNLQNTTVRHILCNLKTKKKPKVFQNFSQNRENLNIVIIFSDYFYDVLKTGCLK